MSMNKQCSDCYFGNKCRNFYACEDYAPINPDEDTDEIIENGRKEFMEEWFQYISEYSD